MVRLNTLNIEGQAPEPDNRNPAAVIKVAVSIATKYITHVRNIQRLNRLEELMKEAIRLKDDKAKMQIGKRMDYLRTKSTPDFGAELPKLMSAVGPWMPEPDPEPDDSDLMPGGGE